MILTRQEITGHSIVVGSLASGQRPSTYDPTVGTILTQRGKDQGASYSLPPRGIAWVISEETFVLPPNITGLATLRTTWTKSGVLTLTLGIIDPGFVGPVSTAVVNFGKSDFKIKKGDSFFRVMFMDHQPCPEVSPLSGIPDFAKVKGEYLADVKEQTKNFSKTFLTIDTLGPEILKSVLKLPSWSIWLGMVATFLAVIAITTGIGIALWLGTFDLKKDLQEADALRANHFAQLQSQIDKLAGLQPQIDKLTADVNAVSKSAAKPSASPAK